MTVEIGRHSGCCGRRYDQIGLGYARTRREDPRLAERIHRELAEARTVVNVGAGTGSYEPRDRYVIAIEPSDVMAQQRPTALPPAIRATAAALPLRDNAVDAAMAILTVHHWDEETELGVTELRRVTQGPVVILTYDPAISGRMWLMADYLPEVAQQAVGRDLQSGAWDRRHGHLRCRDKFDVGLRLIVNRPASHASA
jgi:SAM-dependent methyltransferase